MPPFSAIGIITVAFELRKLPFYWNKELVMRVVCNLGLFCKSLRLRQRKLQDLRENLFFTQIFGLYDRIFLIT